MEVNSVNSNTNLLQMALDNTAGNYKTAPYISPEKKPVEMLPDTVEITKKHKQNFSQSLKYLLSALGGASIGALLPVKSLDASELVNDCGQMLSVRVVKKINYSKIVKNALVGAAFGVCLVRVLDKFLLNKKNKEDK